MLDSGGDGLKGRSCSLLRGLGEMWSRSCRRYKKQKKNGGRPREELQVHSGY